MALYVFSWMHNNPLHTLFLIGGNFILIYLWYDVFTDYSSNALQSNTVLVYLQISLIWNKLFSACVPVQNSGTSVIVFMHLCGTNLQRANRKGSPHTMNVCFELNVTLAHIVEDENISPVMVSLYKTRTTRTKRYVVSTMCYHVNNLWPLRVII